MSDVDCGRGERMYTTDITVDVNEPMTSSLRLGMILGIEKLVLFGSTYT
jgi:hypothetical protein